MSTLKAKKCQPCHGGAPPLKIEEIEKLQQELTGWSVIDNHHLEKEFHFKNFVEALDFTNAVGKLAEDEGHHPDIYLTWGKVKIKIWTHKIDGLHENDFILAAKCDVI